MAEYEGMIAESTTFLGHQGDVVEAYFARPLGRHPVPSIVVAHHIRGWDGFTKEAARRLAYEGFAVLSPNFFSREAPDVSPEEASMIVRKVGGVADDQAVGDTAAASEFLRSHPMVNGKVGIVGWCMGGRQAYLAACQAPFDAIVNIYGGSITTPFEGGRFCEVDEEELSRKHPVIPLSLSVGLSTPMLMLTGDADRAATPEAVRKTEEELTRLGKPFVSHIYPSVPHEYMNPTTTAYAPEAAVDSWTRLLEFLRDKLTS